MGSLLVELLQVVPLQLKIILFQKFASFHSKFSRWAFFKGKEVKISYLTSVAFDVALQLSPWILV